MVLSLPVRIRCAAVLTAVIFSLVSLPACLAETVLLDFSSPNCGPCQQMRPVVQRLANDGFRIQEIDISRDPQAAARFGVTQVPTFLVMVDGKPVDRLVGIASYRQLHRILRRAMPVPAPRQPVVPLGQSPSTFAPNQPARVASVAESNSVRTSAQNLYQPQPNRVVSLQEATTTRPRGQSPRRTNPFAASTVTNVPSRPTIPIAGSPTSAHGRLLASTVKITAEDPQGKSSGTGTIVDARGGEALVLTCGHIFRSSQGKGVITITTFRAGPTGVAPAASYTGHLIDFDLERDLALLSLRPTSPVMAVPIARKSSNPLVPGGLVTSVGCNHGQNPTAIDSQVSTLNRYQGPTNVEVVGAPVEGRSGGGLFNAQGELVGVCYAADPQANEGLYAGLPSIYAKLDSLNLTMIYQPTSAASPTATMAQIPAPQQPIRPALAIRGQEPDPQNIAAPRLNTGAATLPPAEQAALAEIQRRGTNSEVICIIRPQDPHGKSEVITLSNASPAFVQALAQPVSTGAVLPSAAAAAQQLLR